MTELKNKEQRLSDNLKTIVPYAIWPILWLFYFGLMLNVNYTFGFVQATVLTLAQFITVRITIKMLLPKYGGLMSRLLAAGTIFIFLFSIITTAIDWIIIDNFVEMPHRKHEPEGIKKIIFPFVMHIMSNGLVLFISISIKLIEKAQLSLVRIKELERAQTDTELRFLKTQINPHFLFNALNNIYTISYMGDKQAPDKILELSEMLRYVLYDCKGDNVPLEKEIGYIKNYIDFQQLKTENKQNIKLKLNGIKPNTPIAPMLLIPFLENSFKHSKIDKEKDAFVNITVNQNDKELLIEVKNSMPNVKPTKWLNSEGGIGLENVRKRLDLLYPDKYSLDITQENKVFGVQLKIMI